MTTASEAAAIHATRLDAARIAATRVNAARIEATRDDAARIALLAASHPLLGAEAARQASLDALDILDTAPEERFDRVTRLAKRLFGVETALISLIDNDRQWFKSTVGFELSEGTRRDAFCDHTIRQPDVLTVSDAREDPRFLGNALVTGPPHIRFYAGYPIQAPDGERVGALCVFDPSPRVFTDAEKSLLRDLALWAQDEIALNKELDRAAEVQQALLPKQFVSLPGYEVAGACSPARVVGGDFYDWYPVGEGAAFTLADVMGKGIAAALIAATVRAVLRAGSRSIDIGEAMEAAAFTLAPDLDEAGSFVTLFHARLDMHTGELRYVDAGHGLSLIVRADGRALRLTSGSLPLGADVESTWEQQTVTLEPGDTLVSVSDGVLDLFDGTLAGLDEVGNLVRSTESAQSVVDHLLARAGRVAPDDVTVVAVRRAG